MSHNHIINLILVWALCIWAMYAAERSALMPEPKRILQGLATAIGVVWLYLTINHHFG